jgi:hypothetical protein
MGNIIVAIVMILGFGSVAYGGPKELVMDCREKGENLAILSHAPFRAKRISKHHLRVDWAGGSMDFVDKPPYDEPLGGTRYSYCGYNPTLNMHLIDKSISGVFTGVLLDNVTGKIMQAGHYISFSNDKKKYFSTVQPDGLDGEEWYVYTRNGNILWKGLSGISGKHPKYNYEYIIAELSNPRWNSEGELQATHVCAVDKGTSKKETTVTLRLVGKKWLWLPRISCPEVDH